MENKGNMCLYLKLARLCFIQNSNHHSKLFLRERRCGSIVTSFLLPNPTNKYIQLTREIEAWLKSSLPTNTSKACVPIYKIRSTNFSTLSSQRVVPSPSTSSRNSRFQFLHMYLSLPIHNFIAKPSRLFMAFSASPSKISLT